MAAALEPSLRDSQARANLFNELIARDERFAMRCHVAQAKWFANTGCPRTTDE